MILGGLTWIPVYLSTDTDGNVILTLWLSDAFTTSLFCDTYSNIYDNSTLRTNVTSTTGVFKSITKNRNLQQYIVIPSKVSWQLSESSFINDYSYSTSNRNWVNDYLWVPSTANVGTGGTWKLTTEMNSNNSNISRGSWLRSGNAAYASGAFSYYLTSSGDTSSAYVRINLGVRPALHLNLTSMMLGLENKLSKPKLADSLMEYDGNNYYISSASHSDSDTNNIWNFDSSYMTISGTTSASAMGEYSVTISLKDKKNYTWADGSTDDVTLTWHIAKWTSQTYSITFNLTFDSTCEYGENSSANAFVSVQKTDENGNAISGESPIPLDFTNTAQNTTKTGKITNLADGYYKITLTASTNHIATIKTMFFGTSSPDITVDVIVTKNNYGGFYANSSSSTTLKNTKVNGVVSVLSLSGDEVKTISSGLTTVTEYNVKNIVLLTAFVTAITTLLIVGVVHLAKRKGKKKTIKYVLYK